MLDYPVDKSGMLKSLIYSACIYLCAIPVNAILKSNYVFSEGLPPFMLELYPFIKKFNYPVVYLLGVALVIGSLAYVPVYFINKSKKS